MTPRERFLACMRSEPVDRPPLWEWGAWPSTLRRWRREGLGPDETPPPFAECENARNCGVDMWMVPRYEVEVLQQDEQYVLARTERGQVTRTLRSPDAMSMPEFVAYPVKTLDDWRRLKPRFAPNAGDRFGADWLERCAAWRRNGGAIMLQGPRSPSLFGFVRELMGPEQAMLAFHDAPVMVHDMMDTLTELVLALLPKVVADARLVGVFFWEDMAYKTGSLLSPAMFREFMTPRYRRMTDLARSLGLDILFVDSDGNVDELIPLWLEAGLNGVYPMEVAAGMDVVALRRRYGRDLLMTGGLDKRVLVAGPESIDRELAAKVPLAHEGGYIPTIDHAIPHDVPYQHFLYYWRRKKELLGIPDTNRSTS